MFGRKVLQALWRDVVAQAAAGPGPQGVDERHWVQVMKELEASLWPAYREGDSGQREPQSVVERHFPKVASVSPALRESLQELVWAEDFSVALAQRADKRKALAAERQLDYEREVAATVASTLSAAGAAATEHSAAFGE